MNNQTSLPIAACVGILIGALVVILCYSFTIGYLVKKKAKEEGLSQRQNFLTARNTQPWWGLAFSFYAGGMGSWLLFAAPEASYQAGLLASFAYGLANALPFWLMIWLGAAVKHALGDCGRGFTVADFAYERLGRVFKWIVCVTSLFFMFIFLCSELTAIGGIFQSLAPDYPPWAATLPVAVVTLFYTTLGGAPVSIGTDRLQGVLLFVLGIAAISVVCKTVVPLLKPHAFDTAAKATFPLSFVTAAVLIISTTINQFLDQGMWQRVFSAKSTTDVRWGLFVGGLLSIPTVALFGAAGVVGKAATLSDVVVVEEGGASIIFFTLFLRLQSGWLVILALLGVCLVCSTVDSLQSGLLALTASCLPSERASSIWIVRIICVVINAAAIAVATVQYSILSLFLVSNFVSCAVVPVLMLSFLDIVSPFSAVIGVIGGVISLFSCGWGFTNTFVGGFTWITLPEGAYSDKTFWSFVIVTLSTPLVTVLAALVELYFNESLRQEQQQVLSKMRQRQTDTSGVAILESQTVSPETLSPC